MGKTILITGTSSGYGKATVAFFLDRGWDVIATMRRPDPAVFGDQPFHQRAVRGEVVGVELDGVHGRRTGVAHRGDLVAQPGGVAGGEHHGGAGGEPAGQFQTDLAATAKDNDRPRCVLHGSDYPLR